MNENAYVLLTAAKNEEAYIAESIESVCRQSVRPLAWFIMDDGSSDGTARIVKALAEKFPFIHLHSADAKEKRNFGAQYRAIQTAYQMAVQLDFAFVGVHDADIAPVPDDYYESILKRFKTNPRFGIVGGYIHEPVNGQWQCRKTNSPDSVAGGAQMFRRACFEQIGGYTPLYLGGSDWLAQIDARIAGWEVMACVDLPVRHFRPTSSANGFLRGRFREGELAASFGSHPFFELLKCVRRMACYPILIGSAVHLAGFYWWQCRGRKPLISSEKVSFLRKQQMAKVRAYVQKLSP